MNITYKRGISLIVLIITIIVVIILAAVVILTLSKNNPIESAKEARFKEDVRTFQDELALTVSKQYANSGGHWEGNISATTHDDIVKYIPSFTKKYEGKFVINNNNLEYTNNLDEKEKENAQNLNVMKRKSILPDEYQQIEYIESTGTQWIDTGYVTNDLTLKFNISVYSDSSTTILIGNNIFAWPNNVLQIWNERLYFANSTISSSLDKEMIIEVIFDTNGKLIINNNEKLSGNFAVRPNCNIYIGNWGNNFGNAKFYYVKIFQGKELVRHFIPCYRKFDNKPGMYDLVTNIFYTNQGTGEFIKGPDV